MANHASTSFTRKCEDNYCLQVPVYHSVTVELPTRARVMSCLQKCSPYTGMWCGVDPVFLACSIPPYTSANLAETTDLLISKDARDTKQAPLCCLAALARNWANGARVAPCCKCHRLRAAQALPQSQSHSPSAHARDYAHARRSLPPMQQ